MMRIEELTTIPSKWLARLWNGFLGTYSSSTTPLVQRGIGVLGLKIGRQLISSWQRSNSFFCIRLQRQVTAIYGNRKRCHGFPWNETLKAARLLRLRLSSDFKIALGFAAHERLTDVRSGPCH